MKRIFGIFMLACVCLALGLSVRWGREEEVSLVCLAPDLTLGTTYRRRI